MQTNTKCLSVDAYCASINQKEGGYITSNVKMETNEKYFLSSAKENKTAVSYQNAVDDIDNEQKTFIVSQVYRLSFIKF